MNTGAIRSRLFELRRDRVAAQRSAELLEQKREALLREILRRTRRCAELRNEVDARVRDAQRKLDVARVELGRDAIESAMLAQQPTISIATNETSVMGVRLPHFTVTTTPFRARYGAAATTESLDDAGIAFAALLPFVAQLVEQQESLARLRTAMRKVTKLSGALRKVVVPRIEREIRQVIEGIEEEERDESVRRTRWKSRAAV